MARKNKSTSVERSTGVSTQGEKVHLGERVDIGKGKTNKRKGPRDYVSGSTSAYNLLGLILIIGLIATVFFAYYNSTSDSETFQYFSPSVYVDNISRKSVSIPGGTYELKYDVSPSVLAMRSTLKAYFVVDGVKVESWNETSFGLFDSLEKEVFEFRFKGDRYYSVDGSITIPDIVVSWNDMPSSDIVVESWKNVDGVNSFLDAVAETVFFVGDYLEYQLNLIQNILPWNSVVEGERDYLSDLWKEAEERAFN